MFGLRSSLGRTRWGVFSTPGSAVGRESDIGRERGCRKVAQMGVESNVRLECRRRGYISVQYSTGSFNCVIQARLLLRYAMGPFDTVGPQG